MFDVDAIPPSTLPDIGEWAQRVLYWNGIDSDPFALSCFIGHEWGHLLVRLGLEILVTLIVILAITAILVIQYRVRLYRHKSKPDWDEETADGLWQFCKQRILRLVVFVVSSLRPLFMP